MISPPIKLGHTPARLAAVHNSGVRPESDLSKPSTPHVNP